jgi:TRAP-type C4-dicarboxylate transport system substrate-binding protein
MDIYPKVREVFLDKPLKEKWNAVVLGTFFKPGYAVQCTKPFKLDSFEALKGKKIRVASSILGDTVKVYGGSPVVMNVGELFMALQKGIVDGLIMPVYNPIKFYEVLKYVVVDNSVPGTFCVLVNKNAWDELSPDLHSAIKAHVEEHQAWAREKFLSDSLEVMLTAMAEYGVTYSAINPVFRENVREKMKPFWENWAAGDPVRLGALKKIDEVHKEWMKQKK